jgi:hypothetical protein
LVDPERLEQVRSRYGKAYLDIATDETSHYGFSRPLPDFVGKRIQQQFTKEALLIQRLRKLASSDIDGELFYDTDGTSYPSQQALEHALLQRGAGFTVEERVECANTIIRVATALIRQDTAIPQLFEKLLQISKGVDQEEQEEEEERLRVPGERDSEEEEKPEEFVPPSLQFEKPKEKLPLAASVTSKTLRVFHS